MTEKTYPPSSHPGNSCRPRPNPAESAYLRQASSTLTSNPRVVSPYEPGIIRLSHSLPIRHGPIRNCGRMTFSRGTRKQSTRHRHTRYWLKVRLDASSSLGLQLLLTSTSRPSGTTQRPNLLHHQRNHDAQRTSRHSQAFLPPATRYEYRPLQFRAANSTRRQDSK